jgi:formylglycine-generating enzyme required for sulfatase activity
MFQTKYSLKRMTIFGEISILLFVPWIRSCASPPLFSAPTEITDANGILMHLVPAGEFTMGSNADSDTRNQAHTVYLDAFYIDKYEVTNAHYQACVTAGVCESPHETKSDFRESYYGNPEFDNYPVIYVNWAMARTYCEWRGARLPTEAEWEKAARGTEGRTYPWGEGISCEQANYDGNPETTSYCVGEISEVGSYENGQSPYGLYDMAGNVFEWTSSLNLSYPYDAADGREDLTRGGDRVIRGGSWNENLSNLQVYYRSWLGPQYSESEIGFRCARSDDRQ